MGALGYYSAMHHADFMIGNSSSGIIEAASFGLPVINIGDRQKGREISPNTIQVPTQREPIRAAITKVQTPEFQKMCTRNENIYGQGNAAKKIIEAIHTFFQSNTSVRKSFNMKPHT